MERRPRAQPLFSVAKKIFRLLRYSVYELIKVQYQVAYGSEETCDSNRGCIVDGKRAIYCKKNWH